MTAAIITSGKFKNRKCRVLRHPSSTQTTYLVEILHPDDTVDCKQYVLPSALVFQAQGRA